MITSIGSEKTKIFSCVLFKITFSWGKCQLDPGSHRKIIRFLCCRLNDLIIYFSLLNIIHILGFDFAGIKHLKGKPLEVKKEGRNIPGPWS
jgi:hypothetical protein